MHMTTVKIHNTIKSKFYQILNQLFLLLIIFTTQLIIIILNAPILLNYPESNYNL